MTPEAMLGAFALFDRWALTVRTLTGEPLPTLPATPSTRRCSPLGGIPEADPFALAWDSEHRAEPSPAQHKGTQP